MLLISRRINDVEQHGEEKITNQNRERGIYHRLSRGPSNADRAFACAQPLLATDEYDEYSETERFRQTHNNVTTTRPAHHVCHVISAINIEHENRDEITSSN